MNNVVCNENTMEIQWKKNENSILRKTHKRQRRLFKKDIKTNYMSRKIVAIRKNKVTSKLNKPVYNGTCILDLGKASMYEFRYH